jgi:HEPN domain-containing protein
MVNAAKHVQYWRTGAEEDVAAAGTLLEKGHLRHALFFAHLAVEKMLKAHVVKATGQVPPKIHDLLRLAELAGLSLSTARREFLADIQEHCLEGRYPEKWPPEPSRPEAETAMRETREALKWLSSLLK